MQDISRADLDRISQILSNHINTDESIKLASKLSNADVIPKLYAYTYFKKVYDELKNLNVQSRDFDYEEFEALCDGSPALELSSLRSKREVRTVFEILINGFVRENCFCDFDDSKYHDQTKIGVCECEDHEGNIYNENDTENKNLKLIPLYFTDDDTAKFVDDPEWWCEVCSGNIDGGDCDVEVHCDMEIGE